jgi:NAD(P)-dependent dehydrogenase (short-subunit alcohol dehydrogenase family)
MEVDLVEPGGPERLVAEATARHGSVDILVNNVGGVRLRVDGFLSVSDEDFERSLQLNFFAALCATRAAVAKMTEQGEGTIVNVASVNAVFHPDGLVIDYGAAKAALLNVAKALSQELGPKGIRINSVSPGPVATDLWLGDDGVAATIGKAAGTSANAVREQAIASTPTGRFTTPDEVATLVALLASPNGKCHRLQLRDRRRPHQDDVNPGPGPCTTCDWSSRRSNPSGFGEKPVTAKRRARRSCWPQSDRGPCAGCGYHVNTGGARGRAAHLRRDANLRDATPVRDVHRAPVRRGHESSGQACVRSAKPPTSARGACAEVAHCQRAVGR